jgi:hypothetical protein
VSFIGTIRMAERTSAVAGITQQSDYHANFSFFPSAAKTR